MTTHPALPTSGSDSLATLAHALAAADALIANAVQGISALVQALGVEKENPAIHRIQSSADVFLMKHSNVMAAKSWSASSDQSGPEKLDGRIDPFFHDWRAQYGAVVEFIQGRRFAAVKDLLEGKKIQHESHGRIDLAPEVIANLRLVLGDLSSVITSPAPAAPKPRFR